MSDPLFTCRTSSPQANGLIGWYAGAKPDNNAIIFDSSPAAVSGPTSGMEYRPEDIGGRKNTIFFASSNFWAVVVPPIPSMLPPYTVTGWWYAFWVRTDGFVTLPVYLRWIAAGTWDFFYLGVDNGGVAEATMGAVSLTNGQNFEVVPPLAVSINAWHSFVMRVTNTTTRTFFLDGVKRPPDPGSNFPYALTDIVFGAGVVPPHGIAGNAVLDDLRVYNRALTDTEAIDFTDPVKRMQLYKFPTKALVAGYYAH